MTDDVESKPIAANRINTVGDDAAATPKITHAMEDYLKVAYRLQQEGGPVSTQRLADELGISGPSVTNMVKRLHDLQLVSHTRYHGMELTASGQRIIDLYRAIETNARSAAGGEFRAMGKLVRSGKARG